MKKSTFPILILVFLSLSFVCAAHALTMTPYYSYSEYDGQGGSISAGPNLTPTANWSAEHDSRQADGTTSVAGGQEWWGSVSISGISSQGWGEVTSNPEAGTIRSRSGAHHTDTAGEKVAYWIELTPGSQYLITPMEWGIGASYGYLRSLWEVNTDGSLSLGDSVNLTGGITISGEFQGEDDLSLRATMMVNKVENAFWLENSEYIDYATFDDTILPDSAAINNMFWFYNEALDSDATDDPVNIDESASIQANVGDIILVEAMLNTKAVLPNDGTGRDIWAEFGHTLASSLTPDTQGVVLVPYGTGGNNGSPVPEPATLFLFATGLIGIVGAFRRRQR